MELKPQDVFVVLKIIASNCTRPPYAQLANFLGMSVSETHASVQRAVTCRLLLGPEMKNRPNLAAVEEFLIHGLKYTFPSERGGITRGVATAYAAAPLAEVIPKGDEPIPVWPNSGGKERGISFQPLYQSAPQAALRDQEFYEYLALADALRDGRVRERQMAAEEISRRFEALRKRALI